MKPLIYIETSVISYLTARPSRDVLTAARQTWTREWWESADELWTMAVSELVLEEAARGDPVAAAQRLNALGGLDVLPVSGEARVFARQLIEVGALPPSEPEDALHIALATVVGARYLVSWNFAHLVGPDAKVKLLDAVRGCGKAPALLTTVGDYEMTEQTAVVPKVMPARAPDPILAELWEIKRQLNEEAGYNIDVLARMAHEAAMRLSANAKKP